MVCTFVNRFYRIFYAFVFFFLVRIYDSLYVNNYAEGNESMNKKIGMIGSLINALTVLCFAVFMLFDWDIGLFSL